MKLKQKYKKWLCRLFGHKLYDEVYCTPTSNFFGTDFPRSKYYYVVVRRVYSERCGEVHTEFMSRPMRRSELLREGWFIQN